jgi:hypothetical protein
MESCRVYTETKNANQISIIWQTCLEELSPEETPQHLLCKLITTHLVSLR